MCIFRNPQQAAMLPIKVREPLIRMGMKFRFGPGYLIEDFTDIYIYILSYSTALVGKKLSM